MINLDSLNIRKGLELGVGVDEIFRVDLSSTGDILAKDIFQIGVEKYLNSNPQLDKSFLLTGGISYTGKKKEYVLSDSLRAYVFDTYLVSLEPLEDDSSEIVADHFVDIEFLNTKILSIDEFCSNIMIAQKFTGKFEDSIFKFSFMGFGDFSLNEYYSLQKLISFSTIHTIDFFINHKNIVSGLGSFAMGLYRNDIMKQREYFSKDEFLRLLDESEKQFNLLASIF
jgi:hypothetical protein